MSSEYRDEPAEASRDFPILTDDDDDNADAVSQDGNFHFRSASNSSTSLPAPVWMRESAHSFKYKWVPLPIRKAGRAVAKWIKGPVPPQELRIRPWFPTIQEAPLRLLNRYMPKRRHKIFLLLLFYFCWFLTWSLMLGLNSTTAHIKGYGKPANIWCGQSFWLHGNGCGLNGNNCRPFSSAHMAFRCPADCLKTRLLEPHTVGNETLQYQGLVVGGPGEVDGGFMPIYRADSFICQAAIHAGVTTNGQGGCGVVTLVGSRSDFRSSARNGVTSTSFSSTFPRSFTFQSLSSSQSNCPSDSRWPPFAVTATALVLLSLFTTSPSTLFLSTFVIMIFHVALV